MKIPKLGHQSVELSDCNATFVNVKSTDNILVDAISRFKMLEVNTEPVENPKTVALSNTKECIIEVVANTMQIEVQIDLMLSKRRTLIVEM